MSCLSVVRRREGVGKGCGLEEVGVLVGSELRWVCEGLRGYRGEKVCFFFCLFLPVFCFPPVCYVALLFSDLVVHIVLPSPAAFFSDDSISRLRSPVIQKPFSPTKGIPLSWLCMMRL